VITLTFDKSYYDSTYYTAAVKLVFM